MTNTHTNTPLKALELVIGELIPCRIRQVGRRVISHSEEFDPTGTLMKSALSALADPVSDRMVDAEVVCELVYVLNNQRYANAELKELKQYLFAH
jgi:hypothetical protein